jgi:TubC N-terminal docking domain
METTAQALFARCEALDVRLWVEAGKLKFDAPKGQLEGELREALIGRKPELIALLAGHSPSTSAPLFNPSDPDAVDIPRGWRDLVASLPRDQWKRWRDRSTELLALIAHPTPDDFYRLEHRAACEVFSEPDPEPKAIGFSGTLDEQLVLSILGQSADGMSTERVMELAQKIMGVGPDDVWHVLQTSRRIWHETRDRADHWRFVDSGAPRRTHP